MPDGSWKKVEELTTSDQVLAPDGFPGECGEALPDGIVSIERGGGIVPVYDIEVAGGDHTFLADGVVVHNSNYGMARRAWADGTVRPLWGLACDTLAPVIAVPSGTKLWYDDSETSFLQEDLKDLAVIQQTNAATVKSLIDAGFKPDSVVKAVESGDLSQLVHTGLYSVQLQPPGTTFTPASASNGNGNAPDKATGAVKP